MLRLLSILLAMCASALSTGLAFAAPLSGYFEGWDIPGDTGGWIASTPCAGTIISVVDVGGNPDGYLRSEGFGIETCDIGAQTFLPELSGDFGGNVWKASFDLLFISGNFDNAWLRLTIQGGNGWVRSLTNTFLPDQWNSFSLTFDPAWTDSEARAAGWATDREVLSPGSVPSEPWSTTLSDVGRTDIRISGEGPLQAGIDNFHLTTALLLGIDIKPGSEPNFIPPGRGTVAVALLGSDTFDVADVDVTTLAFGPAGASSKHVLTKLRTLARHLQDVNDDGFTDLLSHYRIQQTGIAAGDPGACLTGGTLDRVRFAGCDAVTTSR